MFSWNIKAIDTEVYAIAYSYDILNPDKKSKVKVVDKKISKLRKR